MYGRLGNILFSIYTTFYYCYNRNISYDNIIFCKDMLSPNYTSKYLDNILINVKKYFVKKDYFLEKTKNNKKVKFNNNLNDLDNITFIDYNWYYPIDIVFFNDLFYNKELFNSVLNVLNDKYKSFKDKIAIHIRRGDFVTNEYFSKYVLDIDTINKIVEDYNGDCIIFSDDISWCKENITNNKCIFVDDDLNDWQSLILMSCCKEVKDNSGSTFSYIAKIFNTKYNNI